MVKDNDILLQSVVFTGIGAGLLGYRKSQGTGSQIQNQDPNQQLNS
jgi:hypothetical protein